MVLNFYRQEQSQRRVFENLLEVFILFSIIIYALLHGQVVNGHKNGIIVPLGYENLRITIFLAILILVLVLYLFDENLKKPVVIVATLPLLPAMEKIPGTFFPCFFLGALIFFLVRSIKICISSLIKIKTSISALSIIHALDSLSTGILFCENDGYTILSNYQMQNLMFLLTGQVFRNSVKFYNTLLSDKNKSRYEKVELEGQLVYLLPDETAWMFTKTNIEFKNKNYIHISATDVSENWALTAKLQSQDQELRKKSYELKDTIANLQVLSKEKEIENAKMRAHDILGQRLSLLLRMIQNEEVLDYDLLKSLLKGLLNELKAENNDRSAFDELKSIQQIFKFIGVEINFKGQLPEDKREASLFLDIIRESSTNAVRHGLASQVNIESEKRKDSYNLRIINDGHTSKGPITQGSGLKRMRKRVESLGGGLEIIPYPQFRLLVSLPGGDKSV